MRNIVLLSVLCFVWGMILFSAPVNADGYLVNTTFEPNSAGSGTWQGDAPWGRTDSNSLDTVSEVLWQDGEPNMVRVVTSGAYAGTQTGMIQRLPYATAGPISTLWFGHGENTRTLTVSWFQKYKWNSATYSNYAGMIVGDMSVGADPNSNSWDDRAVAVLMRGDAYSTWNITVEGAGPSQVLIAGEYDDDTYYEFELVLDFQTKEYTANVKKAGAGTWEGTVSGTFENPEDTKSLDYVQCKVSREGIYGYWDNITVSAECRGWLLADMNADCYVDFRDFAMFADGWMECSNPEDPNCENHLE
ncbi:MAG: hypothetical protein K8R02_04965 [Anaerohalosphaeraceae bacterium]|nr:hypothetical protein [Anaerohalosphaeraceae bacterium]